MKYKSSYKTLQISNSSDKTRSDSLFQARLCFFSSLFTVPFIFLVLMEIISWYRGNRLQLIHG